MPEYKAYNPRERYEQTATEAGRRRLGVIEYSPAKRNPARPRNTRSPFASRSEGGSPGFFSSLWETLRFLIEDAVDNWRLRRETAKLKIRDDDDAPEDAPESEGDEPNEAPAQNQRQHNQPAPPRQAPQGDRRNPAPDQRQRQQQQAQAQRPRDSQQAANQNRNRDRNPQRAPQQPQGPRKPDLRDQLRQQQAANRPPAPAQPAPKAQPLPQPQKRDQPAAPRPASSGGQARRDLSRLHQARRPKGDKPQIPNP